MQRALLACAAAGLLLTACGGDAGPGKVHLYDRAPVPAVPERTLPIGAALVTNGAIVGTLPDGAYWATVAPSSDATRLRFDLSQAVFGPMCVTQLGPDGCPDDYGVIEEPHGTLTVVLATIGSVTVAAQNRQNYAITPAELQVLVAGGSPTAAPAGFTYVDYPFLLDVLRGTVVEAHQIWLA